MTTSPTVYFLNGPNTNLYGLDRSGTYGRESFVTIRKRCEDHAAALGLALEFRQSNHEGVLVDWIQEARGKAAGLVINAAGLTYTSVAILDALLAFEGQFVAQWAQSCDDASRSARDIGMMAERLALPYVAHVRFDDGA
jgi:3-dehydroquinate dehydratase II